MAVGKCHSCVLDVLDVERVQTEKLVCSSSNAQARLMSAYVDLSRDEAGLSAFV